MYNDLMIADEVNPATFELAAGLARRIGKPAPVQAVLGILVDEKQWSVGAASDAIYEIGSITKVFTGTLLSSMVDDGTVDLDASVASLVPQLSLDPRITLVQLVTHTSGLPRVPKEMLKNLNRLDPYARFDEATFLDCLSCVRLTAAPGKRHAYSNLGSALLGYVLARQAAMPYAQLVEERLCRPLQLHDTAIALSPQQQSRLQAAHTARGRPASHWELASFAPAGALKSTAHDLLRFAAAQMQQTHPQAATFRRARRVHDKRRWTTMGLGWFLSPRGSGTEVWHTGGTGGAASYLGFVPEANVAVVVLVNRALSIREALLWNTVEKVGRKLLSHLVASRRIMASGSRAL